MRTSILPIATLAITALLSPCHGADDFSALLADLSFSDAATTSEPLSITAPMPVDALRPAPNGFTMPNVAVSSEPQAKKPAAALLQGPVTTAQPVPEKTVDFDTAFLTQPRRQTQVQATSVGHIGRHCDQTNSCDACNVCTPHIRPRLPSSTLYQYFRSNKCNADVWDGYTQKCCHSNQVLHGKATYVEMACEELSSLCSECHECGEILEPCAGGPCGNGTSCGSCEAKAGCAAPVECDADVSCHTNACDG